MPETPFSLQTLDDFNPVNPFNGLEKSLNKQPLLVRLYAKNAYRKLNNSSHKSQKIFRKYLGKTAYAQVKKALPGFEEPAYVASMNYMRAGIPVILQPQGDYYDRYPNIRERIAVHHAFDPYYFLTQRIYLSGKK